MRANAPSPSAPHESLVPAGVLRRLAALCYDGFLLFAVLFFATAVLVVLRGGLAFAPGDPWLMVYLAAVSFLFFGGFWVHGGQTLGMRAWRIRVQKRDGGPIDWPRAALRSAVGVLSLGLLGLGFWWAWLNPQRRTWHDLAAGTVVVRVLE